MRSALDPLKALITAAVLMNGVWPQVLLQAQPVSSGVPINNQGESSPQLVSVDRHQRVWQTFQTKTNNLGEVRIATGTFTELETGGSYLDENGFWQPSQELIEAVPGAAVARKGQLKVIFAPNINTDVCMDAETADGYRIRLQVSGLCYFDASTGQRVVLEEVKDSQGEILPPNRLIYRDAFSGNYTFKAD